MNPRVSLASGAVLGALGVALGAFGAHALRARLEAAGMHDVWETAVRFQLVHAACLVGFAGWLRGQAKPGSACAASAVGLWTAGTLLFSGSLYGLALGGPRWLGPVTPVGGAALIAGWICAAAGALAG